MPTTTAQDRVIEACASPIAPAAHSAWPTEDLIALSTTVCTSPTSRAPAIPLTSIGSPKDVPVPCIWTHVISLAAKLATDKECRMTACCDGPFGAVRELDLPSWFTAEPLNVIT